MQLCDCAVDYSRGLPLSLKVFGSLYIYIYKHTWMEETIWRTQTMPQQGSLWCAQNEFWWIGWQWKDIFLDVAFFYNGRDKDFVGKILDSHDFFFQTGIRNLLDKSLITTLDNKLCMHDLLQEMCWEIV